MTHRPTFALATIAVTLLAVLAEQATAQMVVPNFREVTVARGQRVRYEYRLVNAEDVPVTCRIKIHDMRVTLEGLGEACDDHPRGCGSWFSVEPDSIVIMPRSETTVLVAGTVPREAAGGYYALLEALIRAQDPALDNLDLRSDDDARREFFPPVLLYSMLLAEVRSRDSQIAVRSDSLAIHSGRTNPSDPLAGARDWRADLVLRNDGTVHTRVDGSVMVLRAGGTLVEKVPLKAGRRYVLPDHRRVFHATGSQSLADGVYVATFDLYIARQGRRQNVTPFHVVQGVATPGPPDSVTVALLRALIPPFEFRDPFLRRPIRPGLTTSIAIPLHNVSSDTVRLEPVPVVWRVDSLGANQILLLNECNDAGASAWVAESPTAVVLAPSATTAYRTALTIPDSLAPGDHFLGLMFQDPGETPPPATRLGRTQLLLLSNDRGAAFELNLGDFTVALQGTEANLRCRVQNAGQRHAIVHPEVVLRYEGEDGRWSTVGDPIPLVGGETSLVMPGAARVFASSVSGLRPGTYEATLRVEVADQAQEPILRAAYFDIQP